MNSLIQCMITPKFFMNISLIGSSNTPPPPPQPHKRKGIENEWMYMHCQVTLAASGIAPYSLYNALSRVCALLQACLNAK